MAEVKTKVVARQIQHKRGGKPTEPTGEELAALRELGLHIRAARKAAGLTQEALAEKCDIDPTYVSLLERGERNPPYLTLHRLANNIGIDVKRLIGTLEIPVSKAS